MTDKPSPDHDTQAPRTHSRYPRATPAEKLKGGMRFEAMIGFFPADAFDGFEEAIRELRGVRSNERAKPTAAAPACEVLMRAWQKIETHAHVKLCAIDGEQHYRAMVAFMNELLDEVGDRETHPLAGLFDVVTVFVRDYEDRVEMPDAELTAAGDLPCPISAEAAHL